MIFLAGDLLGDRMIRDIPDGISSDLIYTARMQITVPVYRAFRTQQSGDVFASFSRHNDFAFIHHLMERGTSETADYSSDGGKFSQQVMLDFDVACIVQIQRIDSFVVVRCQFATYPSDIKCSRCILCVQADVSPIMEMLLGIFTGKTQSLGLKENLLPIASIVAGIFVKNPMLKMLLIGLGGANLLNKAGHEALGKERTERNGNVATTDKKVQYRRYPDEPLNPRIVNPVLQGNTLIATIDHVPCTVQLNSTVADAYRAGALPLNTLANAVLVQSDRLRQMASQNYDNGQQETIVRTRGIQ